jgi:hypothetical protein
MRENGWARMRTGMIASVVAAALVAGGCSSGGSNICSALKGLAGNRDDFQTILTSNSRSDALNALDRVSTRTRATIDDLQSIGDPRLQSTAQRIAEIEEGLLPILDQFRSMSDESDWAAVTGAYRSWYNASAPQLPALATQLESAGVRCS